MGEGARARAGGAPPVPERRGQEARAGAGARRASHVPLAPTATLPAERVGRAATAETFRVIRCRRSRLSPPKASPSQARPTAERRRDDYRGVIVMVIVPMLSLQSTSTMNAVMPFWKCVPLPFTEKLFGFTVEMMLSELNGRFGVCR